MSMAVALTAANQSLASDAEPPSCTLFSLFFIDFHLFILTIILKVRLPARARAHAQAMFPVGGSEDSLQGSAFSFNYVDSRDPRK